MYDLLIEPSDKFRWFQDCNIYFANTDDTAQSIFIPQITTLVLALLFVLYINYGELLILHLEYNHFV